MIVPDDLDEAARRLVKDWTSDMTSQLSKAMQASPGMLGAIATFAPHYDTTPNAVGAIMQLGIQIGV